MLRCIALLCALFPLLVTAQDRIGKNRNELRVSLEKYAAANPGLSATVESTDSTLNLVQTEPVTGAVRYRYAFDKKGTCITEIIETGCDSCYKTLLRDILERDQFKWKKLNENQYVSRFEDHLLIELPAEPNDFTFRIFRTEWTKEIYNMLQKN